jgi:predicted metal-binding membrane protein
MNVLHGLHADGHGLSSYLTLVGLWFGMMTAMMAPVAWPWAVAFKRFDARDGVTSVLPFVFGYGAAWLLYSAAAAGLQWVWFSTATSVPSPLGGAVLAGAGLFQLTPLKRACLTHCRNPLSYLLAQWRNGPVSGWRIGFFHGVFCVGCCWALMATMIVVGMMEIWWMLAITVAAVAEQAARRGELARIGVGVALILAGALYIST